MKKAIVLYSGGLDSSTCIAIAQSQGFEIYALSFQYGQRHSAEINAAKRGATHFGVKEHRIITIDLAQFGHSALTDQNKHRRDTPSRSAVKRCITDVRRLPFQS